MIHPNHLKKGDKVALLSPAGRVAKNQVFDAKAKLESWDLLVEIGQHALNSHFQYASTDETRLQDFQLALDNPEIKAIICTRGGYGSIRIVNKLDFSTFMKFPKWIVGFSDITVIHALVNNQLSVASIHGPMTKDLGESEQLIAVSRLKEVLFGQTVNYEIPGHPFNRLGEAEGMLIGGNLSILTTLIGTSYDFEPQGKILFIEDIGEYLYRVDRMMWQLKLAGKLANINGLIVGQFTDMKDNENPFGKKVYEIIREHVEQYNYPLCFGFPAGHDQTNLPLKLNAFHTLRIDTDLTNLISK